MSEELNPAQLRLKRISKGIIDILVKDKVSIVEMMTIFDYINQYQQSIISKEECKPLGE